VSWGIDSPVGSSSRAAAAKGGATVNAVTDAQRRAGQSGVLARLAHRGAYRWYFGTIFALAWQVAEVYAIWSDDRSTAVHVTATVGLALFYLAFIVIPPLVWPEPLRTRVLVIVGWMIATIALVPLIGPNVIWLGPLVVTMAAFSWIPFRYSASITGAVVAVQLIVAAALEWPPGAIYAPVVTATVAISLFGITQQIIANGELRSAQATIASLAASEERARLARDLHDVLGHSLTVVAVKSELAGRLIDLDPVRARAEIADVESLARTALADLRAAVTSYRSVDLDAELTAARVALEAAGIQAHLPADTALVATELRPLFGWGLREAVTNVIRRSGAAACWVDLEPGLLRVRDNGVAARGAASPGNGLDGLRERAVEAGATLSTRGGSSGFLLEIERR
jgi:two-component system sensor histidine kinase DesK